MKTSEVDNPLRMLPTKEVSKLLSVDLHNAARLMRDMPGYCNLGSRQTRVPVWGLLEWQRKIQINKK